MLSTTLLAGCSASELLGSGGAGGGASGRGGAGSGGSGGAGGSGGVECSIPAMDRITWSLTTPDGDPFPPGDPDDDADPFPTEISLRGQVVSSTSGAITIDACPPHVGCDPSPIVLALAARGLPDVLVPEGTFVQLDFQSQRVTDPYADYAAMHLYIENVPIWADLSNPVASDDRIWLAAHDRLVTGGPNSLTAAFDPFTVERIDVCFSRHAGNPVYAMRFSMPDALPSSVTLHAGEEASIHVTGAHAGEYRFRNLRSFEVAEPAHDFAYWLAFSDAP
ncbi:hypothetical protein AB3662_21705 [Sorangium cellulosum]|uniref:hypothetical protein n=1 Tax=Sorangium cellulosum TaxID=56 RepID=UPI003D9A1A10